jgi:peptidoglycan hydrolase-like protein with peptidoglycan-binding domain
MPELTPAAPVRRLAGPGSVPAPRIQRDEGDDEEEPVAEGVGEEFNGEESGAGLASTSEGKAAPEGKQQDLRSPKFAGNPRLEKAFDNSPPLGIGESGEAVRLVQEGLVDDGIALPGSTKPTGELDGGFGRDTLDGVRQFQAKHGLDVDGRVGHQTMGKLDELAAAAPPTPPEPLPVPGLPGEAPPGQVPPGEAPPGEPLPPCPAGTPSTDSALAPVAAEQPAAPGGAIPGVTCQPQTSGGPTAPAAAPIKKVSYWLNAFIPRDVPGVTETVPKGSHAGQTMLPGPFPGISDCFLTDQRSFDKSQGASVRMQSLVDIDVQTPPFRKKFEVHRSSQTTEVDCEDGDEECTKFADNSRMQWGDTQIRSGRLSVAINLNAGASDPCFFGAPDITYKGTVLFDIATRTVTFDIFIDQFPAFEMYAAADGGTGVSLFTEMPPPGNTPASLILGGATREQTGKVKI